MYQGAINSFEREISLEVVACSEKSTEMGSGNDSSKDLLGLLGLLGQKYGLDVGQYTTLSDGHTGEELVQFLVVTDGQLKMTGDDPGLLVVTSGVSCQLEDLSSEVLHDGSKVHWGTSTNALAIVSLAEETVDTSHGELKPSTGATALALALGLASFTTSRHDDSLLVEIQRVNNHLRQGSKYL